jgi:hypothetical protein
MKPEDEARRGVMAREVLDNPIYTEAYANIEERLINQMALAATTPEMGERLRQLLVAHRTARRYLEQTIVTGQMAEKVLDDAEKQRSFADRLLRRA